MYRLLAWTLAWGLLVALEASAADLPFVNWENHPQHALDLSPNGRILAAAHTADARVQLFDVSSGEAVPIGHVAVGIDPVSVRFRSDNELWVVNHISDSVSVIDLGVRRVLRTFNTADEPFDVVFAGGRAFVSCSQANRIQVFALAALDQPPQSIAIDAEDPRALLVSADGRSVYAAIFESGNASTLLAGGLLMNNAALPNVVSDVRGPYAGRNPPPNVENRFDPPVNPASQPPAVGLIVRKDANGRWRDDNTGDWTEFVSGSLANASGRRVGWDLPDRDIAVIDVQSLSVRYISGLMNIGMALALNPGSGEITLVGTDGRNEVRFEPVVNGRFLRVELARVNPLNAAKQIIDLNPQLDYQRSTVPLAERERAIGDPRAIAWNAAGTRGWVAGMGSNNLIVIDGSGRRIGAPIAVGEGPAGLALDEPRRRLYVWNHFEASLSVLDSDAGTELQRLAVFNPLPVAIRNGRPLLYDTHRTSGLGHSACASCHVDGRLDRLAWDLGDPAAPPQRFDQNCQTTIGVVPCRDFQAMKGPMTTQTLQDIIGHEPFHWRGDRAGIEAFNPAFVNLLGADAPLSAADMQRFEDFLATLVFPPNPYRSFSNALPTALALEGQFTSGRFAMPGLPLGTGNAVEGLRLYTNLLLDAPFQCASCHTLPTGMAVNGPLQLGLLPFSAGGSVMPMGPLGENHLGIVSVDGSTNVSIKTPQLRNQYEKTGFELGRTDSRAGFGFLHDGSVDSISRFVSARGFSVRSDQDVADLVALMLAFSGSGFADANPNLGAPAPQSKDSHAAVGAQLGYSGGAVPARIDEMLGLAQQLKVDLVVRDGRQGYVFDAGRAAFLRSDGGSPLTAAALQALASSADPQTWTVIPTGLGLRLGIDRDGDGVADRVELQRGSDPTDPGSTAVRPTPGLWGNPERPGHGFDLQFVGGSIVVVWYTYRDDATPVWYLAAAPAALPWRGSLQEFRRDPANGRVSANSVGEIELSFESAAAGRLNWQLGTRRGAEAIAPLLPASRNTAPVHTGIWTDPRESGWGLSLQSAESSRAAVVYFYDGEGSARWALGAGENLASGTTISLQSYRGFCPDCAATTPSSSDAGSLQLQFDNSRSAVLSTEVRYPTGATTQWRRGPVSIVPSSNVVRILEQL